MKALDIIQNSILSKKKIRKTCFFFSVNQIVFLNSGPSMEIIQIYFAGNETKFKCKLLFNGDIYWVLAKDIIT